MPIDNSTIYRQELPPSGPLKFPRIPYKRHIPVKGPSSRVILLVVIGLGAYSLWRGQRRKYIITELEREKFQNQYLMTPVIRAEEDRAFLRERYKMLRFVRDNNLPVDLQFYHNPRYFDSSIPLF